MKLKTIAIILAIALILGALGGVGITVYRNMPENATALALSGLLKDALARDEIAPIYQLLTGGSVSASANSIKFNDEEIFSGKASGKLYFSKNALALENFSLSISDFNLSADAYISNEMIYVSEDEILDGAYGLKFDDLARELENSIFAYGSGSNYAIPDEEIYNMIIDALENTDNDQLTKDFEALVKTLAKDLWEIACENVEFEATKTKERLGGQSTSVKKITITITPYAVSDTVRAIYDYLYNDINIPNFLEKYEDFFAPYDLLTNTDLSILEFYEERLENFEKKLDDICNALENDIEEDLVIELFMPPLTQKLLKLSVSYDNDELFMIDFGAEGLKDTTKITVEIDGMKGTYEIVEKTDDTYRCKLKFNTFSADLTINKRNNRYTLSFTNQYTYLTDSYSITGSYREEKDSVSLTLDKITNNYTYTSYTDGSKTDYTDIIECKASAVIKLKDTMPAAPTVYDSISDISESDISSVINKLEDLF